MDSRGEFNKSKSSSLDDSEEKQRVAELLLQVVAVAVFQQDWVTDGKEAERLLKEGAILVEAGRPKDLNKRTREDQDMVVNFLFFVFCK